MKVCVTSCAIVMLLAAVAVSPVETARPPGARQRTAPQRPIRVPENLPPPVGEEMRVQAADIDSVLGDENVVFRWTFGSRGSSRSSAPVRATSISPWVNSRTAWTSCPKARRFSLPETAVDGLRVPRPY